MKPFVILSGFLIPIISLGWSTTLFGQLTQPVVIDSPSRETAVVEASCQVLKEIMETPAKEIPAALWQTPRESPSSQA